MADGIACPEPDWRLIIEVERMVRQSPGRWQKHGGLIDKIVAEFGQPGGEDALTQHVVVCPKFGTEHAGQRMDFEHELDAALVGKTSGLTGVPRDAGWWFLPIDAPECDPVWHPIVAGAAPPRTLQGIAARRASFAAQHEKNAALDRTRKMRAAAAKAGVSLPAGVTVLPASARRSDATPPPP
jgi:hypothetical protein